MRFSTIVPVYNEEKTIIPLLTCLLENGKNSDNEIIVVDDGSTDNTPNLLKHFIKENSSIKTITKEINSGKTASIKTGFQVASGDYVAIQDADLEYDPRDLFRIFHEIEENNYKAVYGSRTLTANHTKNTLFKLGNVFLTFIFNTLYKSHLTDLTTCYKVIKRDLIDFDRITSERFGFCPHVTCLLRKKGIDIKEVGINYYPRSLDEGKKIRYQDGFEFLWIILRTYFSKEK